MSYRVVLTKQAQKDARKAFAAGLRPNMEKLVALLKDDPFQDYPPFERLRGDLAGFYSRRINIQHRLVYEVDEEGRTVKVVRMWSRYEQLNP